MGNEDGWRLGWEVILSSGEVFAAIISHNKRLQRSVLRCWGGRDCLNERKTYFGEIKQKKGFLKWFSMKEH